ncbi:MAG: ribonuclease P protein component [Candidatus Andersenbacteria bacterium]
MSSIGRIRHTAEVLAVIRRGQKIRTPYLLLYLLPAKQWRMACVVGKKVSKSAVVRHRIQRQLREIVRDVVVGASGGPYDVVVVALPSAVKVDSHQILRQAVISAVSKLQ